MTTDQFAQAEILIRSISALKEKIAMLNALNSRDSIRQAEISVVLLDHSNQGASINIPSEMVVTAYVSDMVYDAVLLMNKKLDELNKEFSTL